MKKEIGAAILAMSLGGCVHEVDDSQLVNCKTGPMQGSVVTELPEGEHIRIGHERYSSNGNGNLYIFNHSIALEDYNNNGDVRTGITVLFKKWDTVLKINNTGNSVSYEVKDTKYDLVWDKGVHLNTETENKKYDLEIAKGIEGTTKITTTVTCIPDDSPQFKSE